MQRGAGVTFWTSWRQFILKKLKMGQRQKMCSNETIMRRLTDMCKDKLTKTLELIDLKITNCFHFKEKYFATCLLNLFRTFAELKEINPIL